MFIAVRSCFRGGPVTDDQYLFLEPNPSDPLNKEAAEDLRRNIESFKRNVRNSMRGGSVGRDPTAFDNVLKA
jgi:ubiquitin-conjugating enzyme E2 M